MKWPGRCDIINANMGRIIMIAAALFICLAPIHAGCSARPSADDKVLAKVSDGYITERDLDARVSKMPAYYRKIVEKDKIRYLEEMIIERLFYEDAVRKRLDSDKEVAELLREAKRKVIIAKLIKNEVDDKVVVTEDEMKAYYESHKNEFKTPEMWRASHILVATEKEARDVLEALSKGEKFEELAAKR